MQRELAPHRAAKRAAELATVRFETPPGRPLQIDFGEKWVDLAGTRTKIYVFVAVLGSGRPARVDGEPGHRARRTGTPTSAGGNGGSNGGSGNGNGNGNGRLALW